jgi:hypothetical protein
MFGLVGQMRPGKQLVASVSGIAYGHSDAFLCSEASTFSSSISMKHPALKRTRKYAIRLENGLH